MRLLVLVHGKDAGLGVFGEEIAAAGGQIDIRSFALGLEPDQPMSSYDGVLVMGGSMNVHELDGHPWLTDERRAIGEAVDSGVPLLGVCLGSQLLSAVAGGEVSRTARPEIGWYEVDATEAAASDPLLGGLPARFTAYQWHSYQATLPPGAVALAANSTCLQAYRLGDAAWGVQFHAEVTREICEGWISQYDTDPDAVRYKLDQAHARLRVTQEIDGWNAFGRTLMRGFLGVVAERGRVAA